MQETFQLVECTAHCLRCHDFLTVTGVRQGLSPWNLEGKAHTLRRVKGRLALYHRPGHCDGQLLLLGSQRELIPSRYGRFETTAYWPVASE